MINLSSVLLLIEQYKYFFIFPIVILEGPIISIIAGFLAYLGFINIYIIYPLLVLGDVTGDCIYYSIGKYASKFAWIKKIFVWFGYNEKSEEYINNHFNKHTAKTLFLAKVSHGFGIPIQITAGIANVKFFKYFSIELIGTMIKTLLLLVIGFYLGSSYLTINTYLNDIAIFVFSTFTLIILFILFNKYSKSYLSF